MIKLCKLALVLALSANMAVAWAEEEPLTPDQAITAKVKEAVAKHPDLKVDNVVITTQDGTVYLRGMVDTTKEKKDLETAAKHTAGVKKVVNQTTVTRGIN